MWIYEWAEWVIPLDCLNTWAHVVLLTTKNILTTPNISKEKMKNYNYGYIIHINRICVEKTVLRSEQWERGHAWGHNMRTAILLWWGFSCSENRFQFSNFGVLRSRALSLYWKWFQNKAGSKQELQRNDLQLNFKRFMNAFLKLTALSSRGKLWCSNPHHWRQSQIHNPGLNSYSGLVLRNLLLSTFQWAAPSGEFISCQVTTAPTIWLPSWSS